MGRLYTPRIRTNYNLTLSSTRFSLSLSLFYKVNMQPCSSVCYTAEEDSLRIERYNVAEIPCPFEQDLCLIGESGCILPSFLFCFFRVFIGRGPYTQNYRPKCLVRMPYFFLLANTVSQLRLVCVLCVCVCVCV